MKIDRRAALQLTEEDQSVTLSGHRSILYALATGFGREPRRTRELDYLYEGRGLQVSPTLAVTLPSLDFVHLTGWDYTQVLQVAHSLEIFSPLLFDDDVLIDSRIVDVHDRHDAPGCIVVTRSEARRRRGNRALFASTATWLARADKCGFAGPPSHDRAADSTVLPDRVPDFIDSAAVREDQALLYRLCGDLNPLHVDPAAARKAGFDRPILHGLCTLGIVCRSILKTVCGYDPTLVASLEAHFSAPVYPGDMLGIELWQDGARISFRVVAAARKSVVIDSGSCRLV